MTVLSDLAPGDEFLFACQVTAVDGTAGISLALYGPASAAAGTALIAPDGSMSGQLAAAPGQVAVTTVTGFAPVSVGDVLQNEATGETYVARWAQIGGDGTAYWAASASAAHRVTYTARGWTVVGHLAL